MTKVTQMWKKLNFKFNVWHVLLVTFCLQNHYSGFALRVIRNFCKCKRGSFLLRAKAECFARLCYRLSVRLCVTLVICIKTVQAKITKFSLWAASRSLVYRDRISCHWEHGFPSNESVKEGYPLKRRHFAVIGSNNVKTVADRYVHAAYHNKMTGFLDLSTSMTWTTMNPSKRGF